MSFSEFVYRIFLWASAVYLLANSFHAGHYVEALLQLLIGAYVFPIGTKDSWIAMRESGL